MLRITEVDVGVERWPCLAILVPCQQPLPFPSFSLPFSSFSFSFSFIIICPLRLSLVCSFLSQEWQHGSSSVRHRILQREDANVRFSFHPMTLGRSDSAISPLEHSKPVLRDIFPSFSSRGRFCPASPLPYPFLPFPFLSFLVTQFLDTV